MTNPTNIQSTADALRACTGATEVTARTERRNPITGELVTVESARSATDQVAFVTDPSAVLNAAQLRAMADLVEMIGRKVTVEADDAWYRGNSEACGPISGKLTRVYFADQSVAVNVSDGTGQTFHCGPLYGKSVMEFVSGETIARDPS